MGSIGTTALRSFGRFLGVIASGVPRYKTGGITIDWATVTAVSGDTTIDGDGRIVLDGQKYLRYGTVLCKITASGKYGPYKSDAADGRQTLTRGFCFILDKTVIKEQDLHSDHPGEVFDGCSGAVYMDRIASDLEGPADNPAKSSILTAFPEISYVQAD